MKKRKKLNHERKDWGMVKRIGLVILFLLVVCAISYGVVVLVRNLNDKILEIHLNDEDWLAEHVSITKIVIWVTAFIPLIILMAMSHMI